MPICGRVASRPRCRELPKGRTTFGSGCLGYFCLAELSEGLRKSQDRRGAGHAPALSYMNLRGKQIGHVLGYIPGALYGQAVLQGMSRAYQGVLEEAAAPPADLLAVAQSKAVSPASRVSGFDTRFQHPWGGVLFIEYEQPCYAGPCDVRRSFWAYACGWSHDWRRCGAPDASEFSYFGYPQKRP